MRMAHAHGLSRRAVVAARARRHQELSRWLLVLELGWLTLAVGPSAWRMVCACLIFGALAGIACCGGAVGGLRSRLATCAVSLVAAAVVSGPPVTLVGSAAGPVLGTVGLVLAVWLLGGAMIDLARSYDDSQSVAAWRRLRRMLGALLGAGTVALTVVLVVQPAHRSVSVPIVWILGAVLLAIVVLWPLAVVDRQRRHIARYQGWSRPRNPGQV